MKFCIGIEFFEKSRPKPACVPPLLLWLSVAWLSFITRSILVSLDP